MSILNNEAHVLHNLLALVKITKYALRPQLHNRQLPSADNFSRRGFILQMLYFWTFLFLFIILILYYCALNVHCFVNRSAIAGGKNQSI